MEANQPSVSTALVQGIKRHLEGLKRTTDGAALYMLIERGLKRYDGDSGHMEQAFLRFVHSLLDRYARDPTNDPVTRVKARLIVQRVALHVPEMRGEAVAVEPAPRAAPTPAPDPVDRKDPAPAPSDPAPKPEYTSEANPLRFGYEPEHVPDIPPISAADPKPSRARPAPPRSEPKPAASDGPEEFEPLKETLADKVTETITFNKEFDALAEAAAPMLGQIGKEITDFNDLKQLLVKGLDDLIRERTELRERLTSAASYLRSIESDRQQMRAEIGKLRKHNLVDELTGLPRRELFVKNLESEISRVRRYGFSLVLAVLDIDELDRLNRDFGRDAGDAALRCYATDILSGFRQYDLIARYGEDEFAILFPNTQKEGAIRALEKAQKRTAETFLTLNERTFGLPGFSSVITLFAPGDKASTLLARASEALDRAKHAGSTRIVLALPTA